LQVNKKEPQKVAASLSYADTFCAITKAPHKKRMEYGGRQRGVNSHVYCGGMAESREEEVEADWRLATQSVSLRFWSG